MQAALKWRADIVFGILLITSTFAGGISWTVGSAITEPRLDSRYGGESLDAVHPVWINATCTNLSNSQTIEIDWVNQTTPAIMYWEDGSTHILRVYIDPNPTGCSYCKFNSWEDGSKSLVRTIVVTEPISVLAQFDDYYEIGVTTNYQHTESLGVGFSFWGGDIIIYPGPDVIVGYVRKGMKGVSTSSPQIGALSLKLYYFDYWIIDLVGTVTDISTEFDMVTCTWAVAYFSPRSYIRVDIATNVGPLLVSYDNEPFRTAPQSFPSEQGDTHILRTLSPQDHDGTRYEFANWLDGPTTLNWTVTLPNEEFWLYTANFVPRMRYVTIREELSCGGQMSHASGWYPEGAVLNITWTPPGSPPLAENDTLFRWKGTGNGSYSGRGLVASVTVNGPMEETAECLCLITNDIHIKSRNEQIEGKGSIPWLESLAAHGYLPGLTRMAASCELLCPPKSSC